MQKDEVRIDKWMWAVRLFKTRSLATEACKKGKISINGIPVKPSRNVKVGEIIDIRQNPMVFSFKIIALAENRMNAKLVPEYMENVTTQDQLELLQLYKLNRTLDRARGTGRPTKKERRDLETYIDQPTFIDKEWDFDFSDNDKLTFS
jgi:ribosome-associated heat shock protein Hsp15